MADKPRLWLAAIRNQISDLIWPRIIGKVPQPPNPPTQPHGIPTELLDPVEATALRRMAQSERHMEAVNAKLLSLFRLTSLLATLTIAILVGASQLNGPDGNLERWLTGIAVGFIIFAMLQLLCAVLATIRGLDAKPYLYQTTVGVLNQDKEPIEMYRRRQISDILHMIEQHDWTTDRKVDQIAIAHTALRNSAIPLAVLVIAASTLALVRIV